MIKLLKQNAWLAFVALGASCAVSGTESSGSESLGVAKFEVQESADRTTVVGVDADGAEVARLEIVHGQFALSPPFTDDYETAVVEGRKLSIEVLGQRMNYETAGYEPVLEMPAPPPGQWAITALLADPHARAVLDRWQLGFALSGLEGEVAYEAASGWIKGHGHIPCGTTCGTAYYGTINTCGGGYQPRDAERLTQLAGTNCGKYTSSYNQHVVTQCCPAGAGGQPTEWFAQKACPTTSNNGTMCGTRTNGACKACPTYPVASQYSCSVFTNTNGYGYCGADYIRKTDWAWDN